MWTTPAPASGPAASDLHSVQDYIEDYIMVVWHYTTFSRLTRILLTGEIRPASAGVPEGERPIVWFSRNPVWEETATPEILDRRSGRMHKATR